MIPVPNPVSPQNLLSLGFETRRKFLSSVGGDWGGGGGGFVNEVGGFWGFFFFHKVILKISFILFLRLKINGESSCQKIIHVMNFEQEYHQLT